MGITLSAPLQLSDEDTMRAWLASHIFNLLHGSAEPMQQGMYGNLNPRIFDGVFSSAPALGRFVELTRFSRFRRGVPVELNRFFDAFGDCEDVVSNHFSKSVICFDWTPHVSLVKKFNK